MLRNQRLSATTHDLDWANVTFERLDGEKETTRSGTAFDPLNEQRDIWWMDGFAPTGINGTEHRHDLSPAIRIVSHDTLTHAVEFDLFLQDDLSLPRLAQEGESGFVTVLKHVDAERLALGAAEVAEFRALVPIPETPYALFAYGYYD